MHAIVELKELFNKLIQEVQQSLDVIADVPVSTSQNVNDVTIDLLGHSLVCSNDGECHSKTRIFRSATTH